MTAEKEYFSTTIYSINYDQIIRRPSYKKAEPPYNGVERGDLLKLKAIASLTLPMARRGRRDNKGLTTRERCTRPSCCTTSFFSSSLKESACIAHKGYRSTAQIESPPKFTPLGVLCYVLYRIELSTSMKLQFHMPRESVAKHCMAQMSYQTRASKEP